MNNLIDFLWNKIIVNKLEKERFLKIFTPTWSKRDMNMYNIVNIFKNFFDLMTIRLKKRKIL